MTARVPRRSAFVFVFVFVFALALVAACGGAESTSTGPATSTPAADSGGPSSPPDVSADTGAPPDGSTTTPKNDSGTPAGGCNDLAHVGQLVTPVKKSGTAPTADGGTVVQGTYVLTAINEYTSGNSSTTQVAATFLVSGNKLQSVGSIGTGFQFRATSTFTTAGNEWTSTLVCFEPAFDSGAPMPTTQPFTATATAIMLYAGNGASVTESVYTKQ